MAITGFEDSFTYAKPAKAYTNRPIPTGQALQHEAQPVFTEWAEKQDENSVLI